MAAIGIGRKVEMVQEGTAGVFVGVTAGVVVAGNAGVAVGQMMT